MKLIDAILAGSTTDVQNLLAQGVDVNEPTEHGYPLSVAANQGHADIVRLLLAAGARLDSRDGKGSLGLPLVEAVVGGGNTPLAAAAMGGKSACLRLLLAAGAKPDHRALTWAMMDADLADLNMMAPFVADVNEPDEHGTTLLLKAVTYKLSVAIRWLLERGADPNCAGPAGITPLMAARQLDTVELLLQHGADANGVDMQGRSVALHAARDGRWKILAALIESGADASRPDPLGFTPLLAAVQHESAGTVKRLLKAGVDPDIACREDDSLDRRLVAGTTPLLYAVAKELSPIVKLLLRHGAATSLRNARGQSALAIAAALGHSELVELLKAAGAPDEREVFTPEYWNRYLVRAAQSGDVDAVRRGLAHGADPNARCDDAPSHVDFGKTALHLACRHPQEEAARLLLEAGANPNAVETTNAFSGKGVQPLHEIAEAGSAALVDVLVAAGARPNATDYDLRSPLHVAAAGGRSNMVRELLRCGADVNLRSTTPPFDRDLELDFSPSWDRERDNVVHHTPITVWRGSDRPVYTALDTACCFGHREVLDALDQAGGERTPWSLASAVHGGHLDIVEYLLQRQPELACRRIRLRDSVPEGYVLHFAAVPHYQIALHRDELLNLGRRDTRQVFVQLARTKAAARQRQLIEMLSAAGADLGARDAHGRSPLHWAVAGQACLRIDCHGKGLRSGHDRGEWISISGISAMVAAGADVNAVDDEGVTPLMMLAQRERLSHSDSLSIFDQLIQSGAEVNRMDRYGRTALMRAVARSHQPLVEALLDQGAAAHSTDRRGRSALFFVGNGETAEVLASVEQLLAHGAPAERLDIEERSALDVLVEKGCDRTSPAFQRLESAGARQMLEQEHQLAAALRARDSELARTCLAQGARAGVRIGGRVPLAIAIDPYRWHSEHQWTIVPELLAHGADPNVPLTRERHFALHLAATADDAGALPLLLKHGANPNVWDRRGASPLACAAQAQRWDRVDALLAAGATADEGSAVYLELREFAERSRSADLLVWRCELNTSLGTESRPFDACPGAWYWHLEAPTEAAELRARHPNMDEYTSHSQAARQKVLALVTQHRSEANRRGCHLVALTGGRGLASSDGVLAVFPTRSPFAVVAAAGTYGNDMELSNFELIRRLAQLYAIAPFEVRRVGSDVLDVDFVQPVEDPQSLTDLLVWICSDVVQEYGFASLVAKCLSETQSIHLWWD